MKRRARIYYTAQQRALMWELYPKFSLERVLLDLFG